MRRSLHTFVSLFLLVVLVGGTGVRHACATATVESSPHSDHSEGHEEDRPADDCRMLAPCGITLNTAAGHSVVSGLTVSLSDVILTHTQHPQPILLDDTPPPRS